MKVHHKNQIAWPFAWSFFHFLSHFFISFLHSVTIHTTSHIIKMEQWNKTSEWSHRWKQEKGHTVHGNILHGRGKAMRGVATMIPVFLSQIFRIYWTDTQFSVNRMAVLVGSLAPRKGKSLHGRIECDADVFSRFTLTSNLLSPQA